MIEKHPREVTANWVYLRFHGIRYGGNYTQQVLREQARQIKAYLDQGLDVFAYFNNDRDGYAPKTQPSSKITYGKHDTILGGV